MDRSALEQMLGKGLSLAEIGRQFDRHESTVAYWVGKYGLQPNGRERHAAKGPPDPARLAELVATGLSVSQIADAIARSPGTTRHWLREHGLTTQWAERRQASAEGRRELRLRCGKHGLTTFRLRRNGGYRCSACLSEAVSRRRRRIKRMLVEEAGGGCSLCGYDRCVAALQFHHIQPTDKRFELSRRGVTRSLERAREEARKCVLLCSNCHAEVEAGIVTLTNQVAPALQ
jgi:transposase